MILNPPRATQRRCPWAILIAALVFCGCQHHLSIEEGESRLAVLGPQRGPATQASERFHYLQPRDMQILESLLPAPVDDQAPAAREFEEQLTTLMQAGAPSAALAQAREDARDDLWKLSRVLGLAFSEANCPRIAFLMANAEADAELVKNRLKDRFARRRPGSLPGARPNGNPDQWAYPSGNAARAALRASLLATIAPEMELPLLREAWFTGYSRMVLGAHLPADIPAGFALGQTIADRMLRSPAMAEDLKAAKAEWQELLAMPAAPQ